MKKNKSIFRLILLLCTITVSSYSFAIELPKKKISLRLNLDGSMLFDNNQVYLPYGVGLELGNHLHENLCVNAGLTYMTTYQSTHWTLGPNHYYWNGNMINFLINASSQFISPSIKLKNSFNLAAYIEPGLNFEPFPIGFINYERVNNFTILSDTKYKGIPPYLTWNLKAGIRFMNDGESVYTDIVYIFSNMDLFRSYREMNIDGLPLNNIVPSDHNYSGLRLSIGVKF